MSPQTTAEQPGSLPGPPWPRGRTVTPYYQDDYATLYHGDCREILLTLPTGSVDLCVTDPPYNVGVRYGSHDDEMSLANFTEWARTWFVECRRIAATVLITGQGRLPQYATIEPWKWLLCWWKPAAMGRSPCGFNHWEPIALWGSGSSAGLPDIVRAQIIPDPSVDGHPCPKPLPWALGQLRRWPNARTILDPFAGSGTALVAAKQLGRKSIGIEIEEKYCAIAANRLRQGVFDFPPPEPKRDEQLELVGVEP